jgi:hypothetical protein
VFFQETPFLTFEWLGALFVVAPLDCVAHRRHDGRVSGGVVFLVSRLFLSSFAGGFMWRSVLSNDRGVFTRGAKVML